MGFDVLMPISLDGIDLLLDSPDGEVAEWIEQWLPLSGLRAVSEWPKSYGSWTGSSVYYTGQGLPDTNWSRPLQPKLNTWYVPTGASRWSFGLFLIDYKRLQGIQIGPIPLVISSSSTRK